VISSLFENGKEPGSFLVLLWSEGFFVLNYSENQNNYLIFNILVIISDMFSDIQINVVARI